VNSWSTPVSVTPAFGIAAPDASVTAPLKLEVPICAYSDTPILIKSKKSLVIWCSLSFID
jgi:hypothetical protein